MLFAMNFTPVVRYGYRLGFPGGGVYREMMNTDAGAYGGGNVGNNGEVFSEAVALGQLPAFRRDPVAAAGDGGVQASHELGATHFAPFRLR